MRPTIELPAIWVPLSSFDQIVTRHGVCEGARLASVRDGFQRWLESDGAPLPPVRVRVPSCCGCEVTRIGHHVCGELTDGHHRLTIARELSVPLRVTFTFESAAHDRFGWPSSDISAFLWTTAGLEDRMRTLSQSAALELRAQILDCIARRQHATGQGFNAAARDMFVREANLCPMSEVESIAWALQRRCGWLERLRLATPVIERSLDESTAAACAPHLVHIKEARDALSRLISVVEGE